MTNIKLLPTIFVQVLGPESNRSDVRLCVYPYNNFWTKWPSTYKSDMTVHLDPILVRQGWRSGSAVEVYGRTMKNVRRLWIQSIDRIVKAKLAQWGRPNNSCQFQCGVADDSRTYAHRTNAHTTK